MKKIPMLGALVCLAFALPVAARANDRLQAALAVERQRSPAPRLERADFIASPALSGVTLSPDGRHVAYLVEQGEERSLWLLPTGGGHARRLLARTPARQVSWSTDGQWLFVEGARFVASLSIATGTGVRIELGGQARRETMMVDDSQPAALVVREEVRDTHGGRRWQIVRIDAGGHRTLLREDARWIHDLVLDRGGRLQFLMRHDGRDGYTIDRVGAHGELRTVMRWAARSGSLLAGTPDGALYMRTDAGGDLKRLVRLDPDGSLHTVHADPRGLADLDQVALHPRTRLPLVAGYRTIQAASYGIGEARGHVEALTARFPGRVLDIRVGVGRGAHWLVSELGDAPRPRWHLYDPRDGSLRRILDDVGRHPRLDDAMAAHEIPVEWMASDGMRLHGFLLLPPGADPARVPLVAQVHGGPFSHNEAGFGRYDAMAQFLANRGYAVFQPNFRGSTGLGHAYGLAARGDYGNGRVQQDIVEGVRWLLAQGIGDPARVGIVGHSFGGYAALLGVTFAPELFKVGVAGSPPPDFGWLARWNVEHGVLGETPGPGLEQMFRSNGIDIRDPATMSRLRRQSPQSNAGRLQRPLALLAGGLDERVSIRAVTHYAATLRMFDKPVTLLVEPDGAHSPTDPIPREGYLYVVETMLQRHLGGEEPAAPGPKLRDYLRHNLRLAGPEFTAVRR